MKATLVALLLVMVGCGGQFKPQALTVRPTTVFVGDSIIGRWDLNAYFPDSGYVNAGWFGKRTDEILAVFPSILDGSKVCHGYIPVAPDPPDPAFPFSCSSITPPSKVVIFLGWNDLFQAKSAAEAAANIATMVQMAQSANVDVVLVVPYRYDSAHPASWMQPWNSCDWGPYSADQEPVLDAGIRATATQLNVPVVDLDSLFTCQSDYTIDGAHPNASGYLQMHDAIEKALQT
jgi:hypothetical protein